MIMNSYKTLFDLTILTCSHVVLAPIFVILWIFIPTAIWLEDRGPVFYTQNRLGKNGKLFKLYKFRSMIPDAEEETGAVLAADNDLRVTRVGKFIRKRALDELPQVINLWKGARVNARYRRSSAFICGTPHCQTWSDRHCPGVWSLCYKSAT